MDMVLVVEDQDMDARLINVVMKYFVETYSIRVMSCRKGADALEALKQGKYLLVMLDLNLEDHVPGEALLSRPELREVPVVIVSGREEFYLRSLKLQFSNVISYFTKPFSIAALRDTLEEFFAKRSLDGSPRGA